MHMMFYFVLKMIKECSKLEEDDFEPMNKIIKNKLDIEDEEK